VIVDSSALVALIRLEPEAKQFADRIYAAEPCRVSAATYLETAIVIDSARDPIASGKFDELFARAEIVIEPVTVEQARIARQAYRDFGRGSGHEAQLNFGDCFAYALAKATGEELLFKGTDFAATDVRRA
jgi:ribonuclease VapC